MLGEEEQEKWRRGRMNLTGEEPGISLTQVSFFWDEKLPLTNPILSTEQGAWE